MINFYHWFLGLLAILAIGLKFIKDNDPQIRQSDPQLSRLRFNYLSVIGFMVAGDWLQGPVVYALYEYYGFSKYEISLLFLVGFVTSGIGGVFVGTIVDRIGRKNGCILYAIVYIISCFSKHYSNFYILLWGRIMGGIATSLLFSSFESWYVSEHTAERFPEGEISETFSTSTMLNSIVAIASGVLAQILVDGIPAWEPLPGLHLGHFTTPFDFAVVCLTCGTIFILLKWKENFGTPHGDLHGLQESFKLLMNDRQILLVGLVQSLFEGAMYVFVFIWTPALGNVPHGVIFSCFMWAVMLGSIAFGKIQRNALLIACAVGAISLLPTVFIENSILRFLCFVLFEFCCGIYFPAMASIKSSVVPNDFRATIYNIYRVPLNVIVVFILLTNASITATLAACCVLLGFASILALKLDSNLNM